MNGDVKFMKKEERAVANGIPYDILRSSRKTVSLQVTAEGMALVRAPLKMRKEGIEAFVLKNEAWLLKHMEKRMAKNERENVSEARKAELILLAKDILPKKVEYFSKIMNVAPMSIKITDAKTRWGSCSSKGSVCFSWRIMLYPEKAMDYLVVHELSHIVHHDHSKEFWQTVERYMPDYKEAKKLLSI